MSGVGGTPNNFSTSLPGQTPGFATSAAPAPNTNPLIALPNAFFHVGGSWTFLAPTTSTLAGAAYGPTEISLTGTTNGTISVLFPVLEAQWQGAWFPFSVAQQGSDTAGVLFSGNFTCLSPLADCSFRMQAQETLNNIASGADAGSLLDENPVEAGFNAWTLQWEVVGTFNSSTVPVPPAAWLFGSGLIGFAERRETV